MQIHNAVITGSFSYNGADLSTISSSNANSASLSSRTTNLESTSSVLVGASSSFSSILTSVSSSQQQISSSYIALSASYNTFSGSASTRITVDSASLLQVSSSQQQISASLLQVSASYTALSGSYNTFSGSASTRTTQIENVYATTGSNSFRATQSITGSLTVTGQITAQTLNVQQVTSSIIYSSGSNTFGCDLNSRQTFTGSVLMTGSLTVNTTGPELQVNNNGVILGNLTTDRHGVTGSFYQTGSVAVFNSSIGVGTINPGYQLEIVNPNTDPSFSLFRCSNGVGVGIGRIYNHGLDNANTKTLYSYLQTAIEACGTTSYCSRIEMFTACNGAIARGFMLNGIGIGCFASAVCAKSVWFSSNSTGQITFGSNDACNPYIVSDASNNLYIGSNNGYKILVPQDGSDMVFRTSATYANPQTRLTITSTGNIGINTPSPCVLLDANSATGVIISATTKTNDACCSEIRAGWVGGSYMRMGYYPSSAVGYIDNTYQVQSGQPFGDIQFRHNVGGTMTTRMTLKGDGGQLSIGTACAAFGRPLTVASDIVAYFSSQESITMGISSGTGAQSWGIQVCDTGDGGSALHLNARGGNVGINIGAGNAASYPLHVNGTAYATGAAGALSDCRRKQCIQSLSKGLSEVMRLNPVEFEWKNQYINDCGMAGTQLGFIAQEVREILPSSILVDSLNGDTLALKINEFIPILTKAIQEQQCTINALKTCLGIV